jgi:hypothetical protein
MILLSASHTSNQLFTLFPFCSVCQRAAGFSGMVPFRHVCDSSYGLLQLARTIASWFKYVDHPRVPEKARAVLSLLNSGLYSRAHDEW